MTYHAVCHTCDGYEAVVDDEADVALAAAAHVSATGHEVSLREVDDV